MILKTSAYWSLIFIYSSLLALPSSTSMINLNVPEIHSLVISPYSFDLDIAGYVPGTSIPIGNNTASARLSLTSNANAARVLRVYSDTSLSHLPLGAQIIININLGTGIEQTGVITPNSNLVLSTIPSILISGLQQVVIPNATVYYTLVAPPSTGPVSTPINITFTVGE